MSELDRYEIGYRDGESSATADWVFALSEWTQIGDDVATPADAVAYVQRLEAKVARIEALAEEFSDSKYGALSTLIHATLADPNFRSLQ